MGLYTVGNSVESVTTYMYGKRKYLDEYFKILAIKLGNYL